MVKILINGGTKEYKKLYERELNIKIPKGYDIHHIDFNRENNNIENLVMLPRKLHQEYHELAHKMIKNYNIQIKLLSIIEQGSLVNNYIRYEQIPTMIKYLDCYMKCCKYLDYRNYLLGIIPNITLDIKNIETEVNQC